MRLEDMLKNVSGITNKVIKENCWDGQFNVLEGIQVLQSKINEVISAINDGIIKGDKGDTPNVQVGETTTLDPSEKAYVNQSGDMLNPILNFGIPKGDKGDKGDTGKASESIQDNVVGLDTCWSSEKTVGYVDNMFNSLQDVKGIKYETDKGYLVMSGTKNGVVKDLKIYGKSLVNICPRIKTQYTRIERNVSGLVTVKGDIPNDNTHKITLEYINNNGVNIYDDLTTGGSFVKKFSGVKQIVQVYFNGSNPSDYTNYKIMILEGDHTQNPPSYFEGIASVGNGNEIEVLSCTENIAEGDNYNTIIESSNKSTTFKDIKVLPPTQENITFAIYDKDKKLIPPNVLTNLGIRFRDKSNNEIKWFSLNINNPRTVTVQDYSRIDNLVIYSNSEYNNSIEIGNIMISNGSYMYNQYISHKHDKKPILFKDVDNSWKPVLNLRGIDENNCDVIDSVNNKLIKKYEIRSYQTGDETNSNVITDMTNTVYKLDEQLEYEINPIFPNSYENETMILFKYGVVNGTSEFYIDSNLGSITIDNINRLSILENEVFQVKKIVLNGDYRTLAESTYPNDFKEVK